MRRVDYVIHYVESLRRSVTFYRDVIGLRVRIEGDGYVEFEMDNTKFSLFERSKLPGLIGREGGNPPCGEIGFLIEDVDGEAERLKGSVSRSSADRWIGHGMKGRSTSPTRTATLSNSRKSCDDSRPVVPGRRPVARARASRLIPRREARRSCTPLRAIGRKDLPSMHISHDEVAHLSWQAALSSIPPNPG